VLGGEVGEGDHCVPEAVLKREETFIVPSERGRSDDGLA